MPISESFTTASQDIHGAPALPSSWLPLLGQWNMELAFLYGKRLQEYCMLPFSMTLCTSPDDVADAAEKFSETLLADYRQTAAKLAQSVASDAKALVKHANEAYATILLKAQDDARNILDQARAQASRIVADADARSAAPPAAVDKTKVA